MAHLEETAMSATRRQAIVACDGIQEKLEDERDEAAAEAVRDLAGHVGELLEGENDV